jgi:hypothetical protein
MDVRQYFRKLREAEANIPDVHPLVMSLETEDGGKAGLITEVHRHIAAKMIVEGRAVLANEEEKARYREQQLASQLAAEKEQLARRVQVAIIRDSDLQQQLSSRKSNTPSPNGK